jgi:hypothetical protein
VAGLADIRGYDGVDPARIVQLLLGTRIPPEMELPYAATQFLAPAIFTDQETGAPRVSPILDMLNVRYVIFRGQPPATIKPLHVDEDYWVFANERALPRAFVPKQIRIIDDPQIRVHSMARIDFDPRTTAYLEQEAALLSEISGTVEFVEDTPQRVTLSARMETEGLVVLADRWDSGWQAYVNDSAAPILRVNHALRGVEVGPGTSTIRFVYQPPRLYQGIAVSSIGILAVVVWFLIQGRPHWRDLISSSS